MKVLMAEAVDGGGEPGTVLTDDLAVACGTGALRLTRLQREGKGAMDAADFQRGNAVAIGTVLG